MLLATRCAGDLIYLSRIALALGVYSSGGRRLGRRDGNRGREEGRRRMNGDRVEGKEGKEGRGQMKEGERGRGKREGKRGGEK